MQKHFSLTQNMQISHNTPYVELNKEDSFDEKFERISKNYNIHRKQQVKEFIKQNDSLLDYMGTIIPIINSYFPKNVKCITFFEDPEYDDFDDITIFIKSSDLTFEKNREIFKELELKIILLNGFSRKIKNLILMDLWL